MLCVCEQSWLRGFSGSSKRSFSKLQEALASLNWPKTCLYPSIEDLTPGTSHCLLLAEKPMHSCTDKDVPEVAEGQPCAQPACKCSFAKLLLHPGRARPANRPGPVALRLGRREGESKSTYTSLSACLIKDQVQSSTIFSREISV